MTQFLDSVAEKNEVSKLVEISPVENFNEEIRGIVTALYDHKKTAFKRLGTVFNAIFTQQNGVFTLSLGLAKTLIPLDSAQSGLKSCDDEAYKSMIHTGLSCGLFTKIREQKGNKAALYQLTFPAALNELEKLMGREARLAKDNKFIEWWDATDPDDEVKTKRVLTEEQKEVRRIADGIFNRKKT